MTTYMSLPMSALVLAEVAFAQVCTTINPLSRGHFGSKAFRVSFIEGLINLISLHGVSIIKRVHSLL